MPKSNPRRKEAHTLRWSSFFTALMLSRETAPSGQLSLDPLLKYFSDPRLHRTPKMLHVIYYIGNPDSKLHLHSQASVQNSRAFDSQRKEIWNSKETYRSHELCLDDQRLRGTHPALRIICCGKGPNTLSIIARCSKFS